MDKKKSIYYFNDLSPSYLCFKGVAHSNGTTDNFYLAQQPPSALQSISYMWSLQQLQNQISYELAETKNRAKRRLNIGYLPGGQKPDSKLTLCCLMSVGKWR